ncbi:MAG: helix-turn-helix domain-containing protein [Bryobacteraceae bacterium]|jgi:transcriptional regulator with XRE-family HTH domain
MDRLRFQIASGSLTVRRLASQIGISQPHMQNLISGKRALTVEMADRLLEFLGISPLDLAGGAELGGALEGVAPSPELIRYVPLLAGLLGPAHPFPELEGNAGWIPLPAHSISPLRQPVFAELGADSELARNFPGATCALLDTALPARLQVRINAWYAIHWSGGGWLRRLRYEPGRLIVLGQEGLRPAIGPDWIELKGSTADAHIRGLVVWLGGDPRRINPLAQSGYLIPPPAADS